MVPMLQRGNRIGDVLRPLKRGTSRAALVWFLCRSKLGLVRVEGASGASIWYEGHPPCVENRFASFPPYEVPSAANEKPPPDGSDGGFFLQLVA